MNPAQNMESSKRKRSQNYTQNDRALLLNCVSKYKQVVESKKTDGVTWKEKVNAWNKITDLYNSQNENQEYRPVESLKKLYDNIKRNIRKEVAEEKTSIRCTGGGSGIVVNDPNKELALSIMNKTSVFGLDNPLDPDTNDFNVVEDPEQEEIIIEIDREIENETSEENDGNALNWGDYTKRHLKSPLNPKLVPKSKKTSNSACEVVTPVKKNNSETQQHRWSSRRRPVASNVSYSNLSKKYEELADLKLEINKVELERVKMEYELKRQSLELEIDIKKAHLNKITKSPSTFPMFNL